MSRKKSVAAKVKTRKQAYQKQVARLHAARWWRILILVMKAKKKFFSFKNRDCITTKFRSNICTSKADLDKNLNINNFVCKDTGFVFSNMIDAKLHFDNLNIIRDTIKKIVSRVARL